MVEFLFRTELRGYAELEKKLVLVGRTQRLEIWSEENWNAEREKSQENYRSMLIDKDNMSDALEKSSPGKGRYDSGWKREQ